MRDKVAIRFALFGLGFISISTQIYLVREFISVFYGNEFVFGISLANWMILTAAGAWLGRYFGKVTGKFSFVLFLMLLLSLLPTLMLLKLSFLRALLFPYGSIASVWQLFYSTLLVQLPFCLVNGYLFTALSLLGTKEDEWDFIPAAYAIESLGSLVAGILVNFILLWFFDAFTALLVVTIVFLLLILFFSWRSGHRVLSMVTIAAGVIIITAISVPDFNSLTGQLLYPDQHILANESSPYGQVVVTENEKQLNFYENGMLLFSSGNVISNEENVHFAMVQHPSPGKVLLVSGGLSGAIGEVLKYGPERIDYVELNPSLIRLSSRFTKRDPDPVVHTHITDARRFIRESGETYDVVLMNLPEPSTLQVNRFYTVEFFRELRQKMNSHSVLSLSLPTTSDYVSRQAGKLNSGIYATLRSVFGHVMIIPSGRNYFLASDTPLSIDIPGLVMKKGIKTSYVNPYYLDTLELTERSSYLMRNIDSVAPLNKDFHPVSFFHQLKFRLSYFGGESLLPGIVLVIVVLLILATLNPVSAGLFTGGFTGASMEVMLLLSLQIFFGYLYQVAGIVIMIFMLGLTAGAGWKRGRIPVNPMREMTILQITLSFLSLFIPLVLLLLSRPGVAGWLIQGSVGFLILLVSFLVGSEYRVASFLKRDNLSAGVSGNYSAELAGSAIGALVVTLYLIPVLGFIKTGVVIALLNLASAALLIFRGKNAVSL